MAFLHTLYGVVLSSNIRIPGVPDSSGAPDLTIQFGPFATPVNTLLHCTPVFTLARAGSDYLFAFPDGVQYVVSGDGKRIAASWPPALSAEHAATYLMNLIMAFVMRQRGHEVLHASAVVMEDGAVMFLGPSGAGKSTIAAMLALRGFPIITEDVSAIVDRGERFDVIAAHQRVRLWHDVTAQLFGSAEKLPLIANKEWKRCFDAGDRFAHGTFEIAAIYSFDDRRNDPRAPRVEGLEGRDAMVDLIASSYKNASPDGELSAVEFERLGRMARNIPIRLAIPHTDLATAPALVDAIIDDLRAGVS